MRNWSLRGCFWVIVVGLAFVLVLARPCLARYTWSGDGQYVDVPNSGDTKWLYPYVESMRQAKVIVGWRSGSYWYFKRNDSSTRAWWGMCLMEVLGTLEDYSYRIGNTDWYWDGRRWFRPYANDMLAAGLIPWQTFQDGPIRRDEAFSWSVRALGLRPVAEMMSESEISYYLNQFADGWRTDPQYRADMALCIKLGLAKGYDDGRLHPDDYLLRSSGAVLASRLLSVTLNVAPVISSPPDGRPAVFSASVQGDGGVLNWRLEVGPAQGAWTVLRSWSGSGLPGTLASWDGRNSSGVPCPAGWYLAQLTGTYRTVVGEQIGYHSIRRFALDMSPPAVVGNPTTYVGRQDVVVAVSVSDDFGVASADYAWSPYADRADTWRSLVGSQVVQSSEGVWYLHLRAVDLAGKTTHVVLGPYCIDRTPPAVSLSPPDCAWRNAPVSVSVSVSDALSGVVSREYAWALSGQAPADWRPLEGSSVVQDAEGIWYLHVRARDAAGNMQQVSAGPYRVDRTLPVVSVSPAECAWRNAPVSVSVLVSDSLSGVASQEYAWVPKGGVLAAWIPLAGSQVVQDAEGEWYLHVRASDCAGNVCQAVSGPYRIDKTPPQVVVSPEGSWWTNRDIAVEVSLSDLSGIAMREYVWSRSRDKPLSGWSSFDGARLVLSVEGVWYLHLHAVDLAGNVAYVCFGPYRLDKTPPVVSAEPHALVASVRAVVVALKTADNLSGVSSEEYSWSPDPGQPLLWEHPDSGSVVQGVPGLWYLHLRVIDVAGNVARAVAGPYRVKVSNVLPPEPGAPPGEIPDWWTPPWQRSWYDSW